MHVHDYRNATATQSTNIAHADAFDSVYLLPLTLKIWHVYCLADQIFIRVEQKTNNKVHTVYLSTSSRFLDNKPDLQALYQTPTLSHLC